MYEHFIHIRDNEEVQILLDEIPLPPYNGKHPIKITAVTICEILDDDKSIDDPLALGYAFCNSLDNFSKKMGRSIASGRAQRSLLIKKLATQ